MFDYLLRLFIWLSIVGNCFVGVLAYLRNRRNRINIAFSFLSLSGAIWAVGLFFYQHPFYFSPEIWLRFVYLAVLLLMGQFFNFSFIFPRRMTRSYHFPVIVYGLSALLFAYMISFTRLFLFSVTATSWGNLQILGPVYPFFGIWAAFFTIWAIVNFFKSYQKVRGLEKMQMRYLFLGCFFFALIPIVLDIIFPLLLNNSQFIWFSPISTAFFVGFTGYVIIRHRFLDIRLVAARSITYTLLIIIIGIFYAAGFFVLGGLFLGSTSAPQLWVSTFLALIVAFSFQSLRRRLERLTDKVFYKDHYDSRLLLERLGRIMATYISLEELTKNLLGELFSQVKISQGVLVFLKDRCISSVQTLGFEKTPEFDQNEIDKLIAFAQNGDKNNGSSDLIIFEELEEGVIKDIFRRNNLSLVMLLNVKKEVIGLLMLGEKASGDIYSTEDFQIFEILAPQMALAIQNARAYAEIQEFSNTLKREVDRATKELTAANSRLKELSLLKDEFVSIASHELRTPMTAIKSYLWLVLNKNRKLDPKSRKDLQIAYDSTERTITLVKDMLTVSRIEGRKVDINPVVFDLRQAAAQVYEDLKIKAKEKEMEYLLDHYKTPLLVKADREKIGEIIQNLVGNALKFTPNRGTIRISFQKNDGMIETIVSDTGPGIPKSLFPRLFQKFSRIGGSYAKVAETPGTGLGLYIAKQLVGLHGGKIWVKSQVGKGSTFTFSLAEFQEEK